MRIVVVSEDQDERARCTSALALVNGADVVSVTSAAAARDEAKAGGVAVLVVDGDLRPKGGYSLLYELAAQAELDGTPLPASVVLVERVEDRWLADWAHAGTTITKPVDPFALRNAVEGLAAQPAS